MSDSGKIIVNRLEACICNGELDNADMKAAIELLSVYLGLKDLTTYAKQEGISPAAASKRKNDRVIIAGHKFIIDND